MREIDYKKSYYEIDELNVGDIVRIDNGDNEDMPAEISDGKILEIDESGLMSVEIDGDEYWPITTEDIIDIITKSSTFKTE